MKKRVVLCIPNFAWQDADEHTRWHLVPYAICLLAATVRDFVDVTILDANVDNMSQEQFANELAKGYDLIGISVLMDQFSQCGHLAASIARKALPQATIIMGGVYPTIHPDRVMEDSVIDFCCIGEGEELFGALLKYLWFDGTLPERGLAYRQSGAVIIQEKSSFIQNLNELPLPAYDLIDFNKYTHNAPRKAVDGPVAFPYAHIITSRGCPQNCCFCQVEHISGRKFRPRSPENLLQEIEFYKENYGIRSLIFDDDNIVAQRSRAVQLFTGMIERGLNLPWKAIAMAVFKLDEGLIALMAQSGCKYMSIAIESGSPRVRDEIIHKPVDYEHAKRMVACAQQHGIFVSANFVIGFPTETWDEIRETVAFAEELGTDYSKIFAAIPLRHTELWDLCIKHDAFREDFDAMQVSWNSGQIVSEHFDADELSLLRAYEWERINFSTPEKCQRIADMMQISLEELEQIRKNTRKNALKNVQKNRE